MNQSVAARLAARPDLGSAFLASLSPAARAHLLHEWRFWARPMQLPPPPPWRVWFIQAGRGAGKTRAAAEFIRAEVTEGRARRIAIVGETAADVRDVMVEGPSGILAVSPPWARPRWQPSLRRLTWANGAVATTFAAVDPEQLRGPEHDLAWADEVAKWPDEEAWHNLMMGLRRGEARCIATSTPRPRAWLKRLLADPGTVVTRGTTEDNAANLAPAALADLARRYGGTRLGRQELAGEFLEDVPGALWQRALFERPGFRAAPAEPPVRVVVAVDPAATAGEDSAETGIVAAARDRAGRFYVLADASARLSPAGWARRAVATFDRHGADRLIGEANNGGDMVEAVLRRAAEAMAADGLRPSPDLAYRKVTASRGKQARAEPVAALYEQGRVHHAGRFDALEDQMCAYLPGSDGPSPDRVDALVWALTALSDGPAVPVVAPFFFGGGDGRR
ncbi:phage terminase large subunit-like protein [Stella humosa]|uniref:Phage terminase large subunit-like protein n=1 Tax=Stella humosa TaxID=94 RepID=A0A3N1MBR1_9PROT|nr:terminase family protein [Stella humosa]ROQ00190.1 phage terminase large subunit-like protein [Stella humosa]BBK30575.1 large terminase [Stella humosa]